MECIGKQMCRIKAGENTELMDFRSCFVERKRRGKTISGDIRA